DVAYLAGEVAGHGVDAVGEILPGPGHSRHYRLSAQLAFGTDLARHTRHFRGERPQLVDHRVDRFLELQDLTADERRGLAGRVAAGYRGCHLGNVTNLTGEVGGHGVDRVGEILPRSGHPRHDCLAAELAFGAYFTSYTRDLGCERPQLVHHRVDRFLELEDF